MVNRLPKQIISRADFFLMTYVHSGTFFCFSLLECLNYHTGSGPRTTKPPYRHLHPSYVENDDDLSDLKGKRILTTCRHPHHIFLSHLVRKQKADNFNSAELVANLDSQWKRFFILLHTAKTYKAVLINCPPEKRVEHIYDVCNFIDDDLELYKKDVTKYATDWKKQHAHSERDKKLTHIEDYENDPKYFIKKYRLDQYKNINRALAWYKIEMSKI